MDDDADRTDDIILLDKPVHDADQLVDEEVDENDIETEQIVLLDTVRLDGEDFDVA